MKNNDPFQSNPEFALHFKHCGVSLSVTLKVDVSDCPMLPATDSENEERSNGICSAAAARTVQQIAVEAAQLHEIFLQALGQAALEDRLRYLSR